jgi:hypothetical protein
MKESVLSSIMVPDPCGQGLHPTEDKKTPIACHGARMDPASQLPETFLNLPESLGVKRIG